VIGSLLEQRYRVDAFIARGGMSAVYRGLDTRLDRPVAIKVMDPRFAEDASFVARFEREARSAARVQHPNVVAVHDQGVDRGPAGSRVYLVMELVSGATLRDLITERGALPVPAAIAVMEPVLAALAAAHTVGLVHRDVKPENVLISADGMVKVADFGLVRAMHSPGTTNSRIILGTVGYLAPEQVTSGTADARGDVYSAGVLLHEMLTGRPPYQGDTALAVAYRHVNEDMPSPSTLAEGIPGPIDALVTRATRRDPAARPADAAEFLSLLRAVKAAAPIPDAAVPVPQPPRDRTRPVAAPVAVPVGSPVSSPVSSVAGSPVSSVAGQAEATVAVGAPAAAVPTTTGPAASTVTAAPPAAPPVATPVVAPVPPESDAEATVVNGIPPFSAAGPQGTRAMLRRDLDPAPPALPPQQPPEQSAEPGPRRRGPALWIVLGVLVVGLATIAVWWFTAGRWTEIPRVDGQDSGTAERVVREADLVVSVTRIKDNDVSRNTVIRTEPAGGGRALRGETVTVVVSDGRPVVPEFRAGISAQEAEGLIRSAELQPGRDDGRNAFDETVPKGAVVGFDPQPGTELAIGARVTIILSKGPPPKPVPDVRGKTREEAFAQLTEAGFEPYDATGVFAADVDAGRVVRTDPAANTKIAAEGNLRVGVVLSTAVTVPELFTRPVAEAQAMLQQLGLTLELLPLSNPGGAVVSQDPAVNTRVQPGSVVRVFAF